MLLLLLNYVVLWALWKIDVHLISTLVNKSLYYYYYYYYYYFYYNLMLTIAIYSSKLCFFSIKINMICKFLKFI